MDLDDGIAFGARLRRAIRDHFGPDQEREFARQIGMDPTQLSRTLNGKVGKRPEHETLRRFADGLGLPFAEVLGWTLPPDARDPDEGPPRVVVVHGPAGETAVPLGRVVAYVEQFPDERHQARLERWRATHDAATYARLCARVFVAWSSNYELLLDTLDTVNAR